MKKILWIVGGLFFALLVAVASVPFFVDVDQYRPTIVAEANKRLNGKLELGKLKLSLWGAIKIHADSIRLSVNGFPGPMLDTQQFHLEIPLLSIFRGAPEVIAVLDTPKISVVKEASGKMNVLELLQTPGSSAKASPEPAASQEALATITDTLTSTAASPRKTAGKPKPAAPPVETAAPAMAPPAPLVASPAPVPSAEPMKVPALVAGAKLGLKITKGELRYEDKGSKADYQVNGLDLAARNLGLGSTMDVTVRAPVKGSMPNLTFDGPVEMSAELTPVLVENAVKSVRGRIDFDATQLKVEMQGGLFHKTDSMPLTLRVQLDGDERETVMKQLDLRFLDYKVHGKGRLTLEPMTAKMDISTDALKLDQVESFVPMVAAYQLKGSAILNTNVDWKPEALRVNGDLKVTNGAFFLKDMLKAPLQFQVQAGFSENSLNVARAALAGPESELQLTGSVKNFLAPQFSFAITGKSFNVDKILVLPAPGTASTKGNEARAVFTLLPSAWAAEGSAKADVNPLLEMAKNPVVANAAGLLTVQIGRVIAYNAVLDQVSVRAQLQNMLLRLQEASLKTFGGTMKSTGEFELKSPGLNYRSQGTVAGVSAKEAFTGYFPKYKNTLEGSVDANWNISGAAFPSTVRMRSLKGTARLAARDGVLKSVDFQESINSAMQKIPFLKDRKPLRVDNGFKSLTCDLRFDNGTVRADPIDVQPRNQGFVVKGKSTILESLEQDSYFDIFDPQMQLPKELQAGSGKPALQLHVTGPLSSPRTDYEYTVKRLASTAGKNVLKEQAGKVLDKFIEGGQGNDKLRDAADKLRKKFKLF